MAFGAKRIFPLDTKPSVGVGVALPFNAPAVFQTTYTTQESIKYNLINSQLRGIFVRRKKTKIRSKRPAKTHCQNAMPIGVVPSTAASLANENPSPQAPPIYNRPK